MESAMLHCHVSTVAQDGQTDLFAFLRWSGSLNGGEGLGNYFYFHIVQSWLLEITWLWGDLYKCVNILFKIFKLLKKSTFVDVSSIQTMAPF